MLTGESDEVMHIDLDAVLRQRMGKKYRYIPHCFIRYLQRLIHEDGLNLMLEVNKGKEGVDFCRGVLDHLNVTYDVHGSFPDNRKVVIMSNHPLGGLDGMAMSCAVADNYGKQGLKFIVNDLLKAIVPLRTIFLPVNKLGRQSRQDVRAIDEAFASPDPIIMFPAGLVSRKGKKGVIADRPWHKMGIMKAIQSGRDVIPVWFSGRNSKKFYNFARWRERLGIKLNIEMVLLPGEVFASRDSHYDIMVGETISNEELAGRMSPQQWAAEMRNRVYNLAITTP